MYLEYSALTRTWQGRRHYAGSRGTPYLIEMQSKPVPLLLGPFKYSDKVIANVGGAIDAKYRQIVLQSVVVHKPLNSSANNWSNGNWFDLEVQFWYINLIPHWSGWVLKITIFAYYQYIEVGLMGRWVRKVQNLLNWYLNGPPKFKTFLWPCLVSGWIW